MHESITGPAEQSAPVTVSPLGRPAGPRPPGRTGRPRTAAVLRIVLGMVWAVNASFKWLPDFVSGHELAHQFGIHAQIKTPVVAQWIALWQHTSSADPSAFAITTAVIESLIALALLTGTLTNVAFIGSAVYSFGVWSAAEAFGLPWNAPGITDVGPSVAYIFAALALYCAAAGSVWSVDRVLRPRLGRFALLASRPS
jgi:uncharacterized membrane protein YphA (DoxX/SURF4 family)